MGGIAKDWIINERKSNLDAWSSEINERYFSLRSERVGNSLFDGHLRGRKIGSISILGCSSTGITYRRDNDHVRSDSSEGYLVTIPDSNTVFQTQSGISNEYRPGTFFLERIHEPYEFIQPTRNKLYTIAIDGKTLNHCLRKSDIYCGISFSANDGIGRLFVDAVRSLLSEYDSLLDPEMEVVASHLVDLLGLAVRDDKRAIGSDCSPVKLGHLKRVDDFIRKNICNHYLDPEMVAEYNKISLGYLHRLFLGTGRTVSKHIRQMRLEYARTLIASRADLRISDICYRSGFSDLSSFSRSFKAEFDIAPSEMRAIRNVDEAKTS